MTPPLLEITALQGLVFGLLTLPICLWTVWTDVTDAKIKNVAVLALVAVFVVAAPFLMPLGEFAWRWTHMGVALALGFALFATVGIGAGDAKFMAAAAPFVALGDLSTIALIYCAFSVALVLAMALARRSARLRTAAPGWIWLEDGNRRHLPLGVGLAPTLSVYFLLGALQGA